MGFVFKGMFGAPIAQMLGLYDGIKYINMNIYRNLPYFDNKE